MKQPLCCSRTESFNSFFYNINRGVVAHWLIRCLWIGRSWVRILYIQPPRQGPWASPSLTVYTYIIYIIYCIYCIRLYIVYTVYAYILYILYTLEYCIYCIRLYTVYTVYACLCSIRLPTN